MCVIFAIILDIGSSDPLHVAQLMIQKTRAQGVANLAQIQNLLFNTTDDGLINSLNYCFDRYGDAIFNWLKLASDYSNSSVVTASAHAVWASQRVLRCNRRFVDYKQTSPISSGNASFQDMAQIVGDILLSLKK